MSEAVASEDILAHRLSENNLAKNKAHYELGRNFVEKLLKVIQQEGAMNRQLLLDMLVGDIPLAQNGSTTVQMLGHVRQKRMLEDAFRTSLAEACNAGTDKQEPFGFQWCPIVQSWFRKELMVAAHILPLGAGHRTMTEVYDCAGEETPDIFGIGNGLLVSTVAERMFHKGHIALVPDVSQDAANEEIDAWWELHPRSYKIFVFDPTHGDTQTSPMTTSKDPGDNKCWRTYHGQRVCFRGDHRPCAKYLFWQWLVGSIGLARSSDSKSKASPSQHHDKSPWGTSCKWIERRSLLGFAHWTRHVFQWHEFEDEEDDDEIDVTAALVAAVQSAGIFWQEDQVRMVSDKQDYEKEDVEKYHSDSAVLRDLVCQGPRY